MELKIKNVIGFNGKVSNSMSYSNSGKHLIYPLGPFLVVKNTVTGIESFLDGHTEAICSCFISHDGRTAASGQTTLPGRRADIRIWDLEKAIELNDQGIVMIGDECQMRMIVQHLGRVESMAFSPSDKYLLSLGGQDDNQLLLTDVETGVAVSGAPAHKDTVAVGAFLNNRDDRFVTAGTFHCRVWQIDYSISKLHVIDVKLGSVKRYIQSIAIDPNDHFAYCGTESGDILKIKIDRDEMRSYNDPDTILPSLAGVTKDKYPGGVASIVCVKNPETGNTNLIVGSGDGTLCYVNTALRTVNSRKTKLLGGVTSITMNATTIMVGTDQCNRYKCSLNLRTVELIASCHYGPVHSVSFPEGSSDLLLSTSSNDLRVWHLPSSKELLRVQVPTHDCYCAEVTATGSAIISGWSDGKVRSFAPQTGKLRFSIAEAHVGAVSALAVAGDDSYSAWKLVTGGADGRVRIWEVTYQHQIMLASLAEHRGMVNAIKVNAELTEAVTASADGSCIVWSLERYVRLGAFFESNLFKCLAYHPDESQMLTGGTNGKITYWDAVDGSAIREVEGDGDYIMSLDVIATGEFFVSGGGDKSKKVNLVHYDDGDVIASGRGHSGAINDIKFSPDMSLIASVGSTGEVIVWECPDIEYLAEMHGNQ